MVNITWTELALKDIRSVYDYISEDSFVYAERYVNILIQRIEILYKNPLAGKIVPEFKLKNTRQLLEGNYRIIYKINNHTSVSIVRIHHSAKLLKKPK